MKNILKKATAAVLSAAVMISSAAYAEKAVYDKATNTVTVDASGYSTVSIVPENADVSDKDNIIYINQTAMDFGAQASFVLQDNPADGDYIISLGNGADTSEVKKIKFTVGGSEEEYPFYASFKKNDDNSLTASAEFTSAVSGTMLFVLYGKDGTLTDVNVQNVTETGIKEHTFKNCESGQKIKLMLWKNIDNLEIVSKPYEIPTDDVTAAPDVLRVTENGELAKNDGEAVQLKGVNFGGWLIQETWMCPVMAFNGNITVRNNTENGWAMLDTLDELETRFGKDEAAKLIANYQDNYITEQDFKNVKDMGFNCVRIPFWYRNFMSDENGTYITSDDNDNPGFKKLDWACDMAEKYGLYLIFDMHGCPGGQNGDHSSGKTGRNYLYKEEKYQNIMEDLWVKIAGRYKNKTCVAAYDIMNEPLNNADAAHNVEEKYRADVWSDTTLRTSVYDRMVKAVRRADPYHVITLEAIWRMKFLPDPSEYGWTNMMYQLHSYDTSDATTTELVNSLEKAKNSYHTAAFMGEFNPQVYNKNITAQMNAKGISYTMWNYKTTALEGSSNEQWGLYSRTYTRSDMCAVMGADAANKVIGTWSSSGGVMFHLGTLTDEQIKQLYTQWWTKEYLATENGFKLNSTLKGYLQ